MRVKNFLTWDLLRKKSVEGESRWEEGTAGSVEGLRGWDLGVTLHMGQWVPSKDKKKTRVKDD